MNRGGRTLPPPPVVAAAGAVSLRGRKDLWLLAVLLAAGAALRFHDIGRFGFWTDELYHVFAAKSLLAQGTLFVPVQGEYDRCLPVTHITAAAFRAFGESEAAARAPFALINLVFIGLSYAFLRRRVSQNAALLTALVMALSPFPIYMSRECRMYTLFQALYFFMSVFWLLGFENSSRSLGLRVPGRLARWEERWSVGFPALGASAALFGAAAVVHDLSFNFVFVLAAYGAAVAAHRVFTEGPAAALRSKHAALVAALAAGLLALTAFRSDFVLGMARKAVNVPVWASYKADDFGYYRYFLSGHYPALFFMYPLSAWYMVKRLGRPGLFFVLSFAVLFLLHVFAFGRKADRYIFYIFPFFTVGAVYLLGDLLPALYREIERLAAPRIRAARILFLTAALPAANVLAYPWLGNARHEPTFARYPDWKNPPRELADRLRRSPVMTTDPRAFYYYYGTFPRYYFMTERRADYDYEPGLILSFDEFKAAVEETPGLLFITSRGRLHNDSMVTQEMRDHVSRRMALEARPDEGKILVFGKKAGA
jgi:4-amino-4-deoxy-L-arabinose transferase-like glycosyltransferase